MDYITTESSSSSKRTSEEINETDSDGNAKKAKVLEIMPPNKVLHIKNIPGDCTELELSVLVAPFGKPVKIILVTQKNHGFVCLETVEQALALMEYYQQNPPLIR